MLNHRIRFITIAFLAVFGLMLLAGSVASAQGPTPATVTATSTPTVQATKAVTSTVVMTSTATTVPPTATKVPPTATLVPPTATKVPPTATKVPPTATKVPPTATKVPPTIAKPSASTRAAVSPRSLGVGSTDTSSFTVQNIDSVVGSVTVIFYDGSGNPIQPSALSGGASPQPNPFSLNPGQSYEIATVNVPGLAPGIYAVVLQGSMKIGAIANILGTGAINFNESYTSFSNGASPFYLPAITFNYYGWYSLVSVQNIGSGATNVTVAITCLDGTTGTLTANNVAQFASVTFDLYNQIPVGFSPSTQCNGSAQVTSTSNSQPLVAVDNQRVPTGGNMQSYSGVASGAGTLYVPALYNSYYGWNGSLNILKIGTGATHITITYSDGGSSSCDLTDSLPSCQRYMPTYHPSAGYFGATISSSPSMPLVAVANAASGSQAQTYNAIDPSTATSAVGIPAVMKMYYGWNTSVTCQNVGTVPTTLHVVYDGFAGNAYDTPAVALNQGQSKEIFQPGEAFLPNGYRGGLTVTANAGSSAKISCIINFNNPGMMASTLGSWSMSTNAFGK